MQDLIIKIKEFIKTLNEKGIPTPICRDMVTKEPSITYTMLIVAFTLVVAASFKLGNDILGLDYDKCIQLLGYVGVGYIGRKYQKGSTTTETEQKGE